MLYGFFRVQEVSICFSSSLQYSAFLAPCWIKDICYYPPTAAITPQTTGFQLHQSCLPFDPPPNLHPKLSQQKSNVDQKCFKAEDIYANIYVLCCVNTSYVSPFLASKGRWDV